MSERAGLEQPEDGLSEKERLKQKLKELIAKDPTNEATEEDLAVLLELLEEDDNPDDDTLRGKHGDYTIGGGFVGANNLFDEGPNDSIQNINAALEMAVIAKATLGDQTVYMSNIDNDPEQQAIMAYTAQLAGLSVGNAPDHELSPEQKQKIDQAWEQMQREQGLKPAEPQQDMTREQREELERQAAANLGGLGR